MAGLYREGSSSSKDSWDNIGCDWLVDDIYRLLLTKTQHSDKYRDIESLRWSDEELIRLLSERIRFKFKSKQLTLERDPFSLVFPSKISTSNTANWLMERTLRRPRELLQLARLYTQGNETNQPDADLLKSAEKEYSGWKLDDLCTEFQHQYPGLDTIFSCWKAKCYRQKYHLKREEIDNVLFTILDFANCKESWFTTLRNDVDILGFLNILYQIGFIGDFILGGQGGSKIVYSTTTDAYEPRFDEVQIHPCFRKALDTVERNRK